VENKRKEEKTKNKMEVERDDKRKHTKY